MIFNVLLIIVSFLTLAFSTNLVVKSVIQFAKRLHISIFATSFLVLGLLTSLPEIFVGTNAVLSKKPEVFVGNLLGGSLVLFIFVIPLLAIFGNGIKLTHQLSSQNLIFSLFVILIPIIFILDGGVSRIEAAYMVLSYILLIYFVEKKKGLIEEVKDRILDGSAGGFKDLLKIIVGALLIFLASRVLVEKTILLATNLQISAFIISLLGLSIGTNLPEISIAIQSIVKKNKEVAFGDYIGSAASNTLIFGILELINGPFLLKNGNYLPLTIIFILGLTMFYLFAQSQKEISRKEGFMLFFLYILFVISSGNF